MPCNMFVKKLLTMGLIKYIQLRVWGKIRLLNITRLMVFHSINKIIRKFTSEWVPFGPYLQDIVSC